jgi:hypothetical protein
MCVHDVNKFILFMFGCSICGTVSELVLPGLTAENCVEESVGCRACNGGASGYISSLVDGEELVERGGCIAIGARLTSIK